MTFIKNTVIGNGSSGGSIEFRDSGIATVLPGTVILTEPIHIPERTVISGATFLGEAWKRFRFGILGFVFNLEIRKR